MQVRVAAGKLDSIKRAARRTKRGDAPKEPDTIQSVPCPLPEQFLTTGGADDMPFLLYDNQSNNNRIIMFGTEAGLDLLEASDTWFMDGTFGTAPPQFQQLFVIHVPLGDTAVSAVYAFLPSKTQAVYEECFSGLLDACLRKNIRPNPSTMIVDFEVSKHNAIRSMFGNVEVKGCFYHLTQSTWRKVQSEGLAAMYRDSDEVKQFIGMIDGLAFLPVNNVPRGMNVLKETAPESLEPILDYFDNTYVSGGFRAVQGANGLLRMRRTQPRFQPLTWNVNDATINDNHRTNNICESWNNKFRHLVGHSNPSLWTVISCLQKDQTMVNTEIERNRIGQPSSKRAKRASVTLQKRLKKLCCQYRDGDKTLVQFLHAIGKCIRL